MSSAPAVFIVADSGSTAPSLVIGGLTMLERRLARGRAPRRAARAGRLRRRAAAPSARPSLSSAWPEGSGAAARRSRGARRRAPRCAPRRLRPGCRPGARARRGAHPHVGRRSQGPVCARAPRRRRSRRRAHAPDRGGQHHSSVRRRRAIWVRAGGRNFAPAVEALIASPSPDCRVVIEAGDLGAVRRCARSASARRMPSRCPAMPTPRTRPRSPDRRRDARGRPDDLAGGARRARSFARRRPSRFSSGAAQARALRARQDARGARRRHGGGRRRLDHGARWLDRRGLRRTHW